MQYIAYIADLSYTALMNALYDVVIIGAGVIGLTQAAALTQKGFRVAVIDQTMPITESASPDFDVRVFALNRYTQRYLEICGIWDHILQQRATSYEGVKLAFGTSQASLNLNASDDAEPNLGHIVEQSVWRNAALSQLSHSDSCDFYWGYTLESIKHHEKKCIIQVCNKNQKFELESQLLVGADGKNSKVRTLSHISLDTFSCKQTALIFNIQIEKPHQFKAYQYFSAQGITAFLPLPDPHYYSMVWSIPNKQDWIQNLSDAALACELNHICQNQWGALKLTSNRHAFPLMQEQAQQYVTQETALIGDAAHVIHPLAGQGANLGVADVAELTEQISEAKHLNRPLGDSSHLKRYERTRRSAAWQMMGFMSSFQIFSDNPWLRTGSAYFFPYLNKFPPLKNILTRFALYQFTK